MAHQCSSCNGLCTSRISLFDSLTFEEQKELIAKAQHLDYQKGDIIFHENDPADRIMIIRYGKIKINRYSLDGKEYVLDILDESDFYGEQNIFGGNSLEANAVSMGDSGVCLIYLKEIQELILRKPEIGIKLLNVIGQKLSLANELVRLLSINNAKSRIAGFILFRSSRINSETIELTREDIAAYINVRRETISRKMGELCREGAIALEGNRKVKILKKDILRETFENDD